MDLRIKKDDKKLTIELENGLGWRWPFVYECSSEGVAVMLRHLVQKYLYDVLSRIRRNAYEAGYKAGRAKKKRAEYFSGRWED
jgi:hypothetical protein